MTLGTHAIAGAAIASFSPTHPVLVFCAGFASHFVLDAIPHYDYPIYSDSIHPKKSAAMHIDARFLRDVADFTLDAGIGSALALLAFGDFAPMITIFAGGIGAILPDPLQFISKKLHLEPLLSLQYFHQWIHTSHRMRERSELLLGVVSQLALVIALITAVRYLHPISI